MKNPHLSKVGLPIVAVICLAFGAFQACTALHPQTNPWGDKYSWSAPRDNPKKILLTDSHASRKGKVQKALRHAAHHELYIYRTQANGRVYEGPLEAITSGVKTTKKANSYSKLGTKDNGSPDAIHVAQNVGFADEAAMIAFKTELGIK
jgi:hypothetical protein